MESNCDDRRRHHVDKSIPVDDMTYKELQNEAMDCDLPANLKLIEMKTMLKAKRAGDEHVVGNILSQYRERRTNSRKNKRASLKPSTTPEKKNKRKRVKSRQEDFIYSPVSEAHYENPSSYPLLPTSSTSSNYRMAVQCDRSQRSKKVMKTATDTAAKQGHYENSPSYTSLPTSSTSSNYRMAVPYDSSQTSKKVMKTATDTAAKQTNTSVSVPQQPRYPTLRELLQSTPCMPLPSPNHFENFSPKLSGVSSLPKHPSWPPVREMRGEDMPIDTLHYPGSSSTYNMQGIGQARPYDLSSGRHTATTSNMYSSLASYQKIPPTYTYSDTPNQLPQNANHYETAMMLQVPERQHHRLNEDTMLQFPERPYLRWDDNSMVLPEKPYHKWNENTMIQFPERSSYNNQSENAVVHVPQAYNAGETIIPDPLPPFYSLFGDEVSKKLPLPYNRGESTISVPSPVECNEVLPMEALMNIVPGYDDKATSSVPYPQCNTVLPSYPPPYGRNAETTSEQPWPKFAPGYSLNNNTMQIPSAGLPSNCTQCSSVMPVCPPTYGQNANTLAEQSSLKLPVGYSSYDYTEPVGSVGSQLPSLYDQRNSMIPIYPPKFGQNANTLQHPSLTTNTKREQGLLSETLMRQNSMPQNSMPQNRLYGQNINTVPEDQHSTLVTRHKREQVLLSETLTVSRLNGMPQNVLYGQNMPEKLHSTLATRRKHDQAFLSGTQTNPSRNNIPQNWLYSQNINTIPGEQPSLLVNKNNRMRSLLSESEMQSGIDFMIQNALFGENLNSMQEQFSSVVTKRKRAAAETVTSSTLNTAPENRSYGSNVSNVNTVLLEQPSTLNIGAKQEQALSTLSVLNTIPPKGSYGSNLSSTPLEQPSTLNNNSKPAQEFPTHSRLNTIPPKGSFGSNLSTMALEHPSALKNNSKPVQELPTHSRLNSIPPKGSFGSNLSTMPLEQPSTLNINSKPVQELPTHSRLNTIPPKGSFGSNFSTSPLEQPSTLNNNSKPEQALSTETITDSKLNGKPQNEKPANSATPICSTPSAADAEVCAADTTQELDFDSSETLEVESPSLLEDPWWNPDNTEKQQQPNFHHNNELSYPLIYSYLASTEDQLKEQEGEKQQARETEPEACPSASKQPDVPAEVEVEVVDQPVLDEAMVELICGGDKKKKEQEEEARELDRPLASSTPKEGINPDQVDILPVPVKEVPPLSESMLKEIRNDAKTVQLEDRQERYDCVNRDHGCPRAGMGPKEFEHHKQICMLQPFKCFNGCKWKGTLKDFRTHLYKLHSNSILRGTESSQSVSMHVVRLNRNVMFLRKVINRLFVLTVQCHGHLVYVTIQHLPPWKDKQVKMFARLEVVGMNGKRLGWSGKVKPMYIPSESMWNSKQCLVVDPAVIGAIAGSSLLIHDMITVYRVKDDTSHESDSD